MNSNQKSHCERNHEFIRYVIPKGEAKDEYTEEEIERLMNHIGSYPRKKWNGQNFKKAECNKNFKKRRICSPLFVLPFLKVILLWERKKSKKKRPFP